MIAEQWCKDANWGRQKYLYETCPTELGPPR